MKLHEDKDTFLDLVEGTSQAMGLPQVHVEKDYWVTNALRNLSRSDLASYAVFKGGTSLSKAYKLIQRFSEDIDLAVMAGDIGSNKCKKLLKDVESATNIGLKQVEDERTSKGSKYRKAVYQYPREIESEYFGQASPELLIEVNAFTRPEPFEPLEIQSLIAEVLVEQSLDDIVGQYALQPFKINVLSIKRTLVEKLLGVVKDSYKDDPVAALAKRIRHLYDLHFILGLEEYQDFLCSDAFSVMCETCIQDEKDGFFGYSDCLEKPLIEAPLFSGFSEWSTKFQQIYEGDFADLVYGELPPLADIADTLNFIKNSLP
ncbi:MAG: nucleotidyl transferase AbiEii/AbiGii toxin family protein [Gammaproteobacteria bacterium]